MLLIPHTPLLVGAAAPIWDAIDLFAPYYMLVGDFARNGEFLLWNPFTLGGSPDYLEPQLGSFSPLIVLFGLLFGGTRLAFELYWLAIWLLGGFGVLALARHLGAPPWGAFLGAVAFSFSGFYTGNAEHTALLYSISFLPWLVWRVDIAVSARSFRPAVEAGALIGLSGLGGYPALVFLNGCFAFLWSVGRVVWPDEAPRAQVAHQFNQFKRFATVHVIVVLVGAAVMSPTYVPLFIEGPDVSDRAGPMKRDDAVANNALHPAAVVTLSSPVLSLANLYEYTDISMRSLYVGALIPAFAAFALLKRRRSAFRWWLLALALLFLASAMGRALPLRDWLYDWVPPTRYFRQAALFRCYTIFALTVLAILGVRDLTTTIEQDWKAWRRFAVTVVCVAAVALATYTSVVLSLRGATPLPVASHWHTYGSWIFLCVVALVGLRGNRARWREVAPVAFVVLAAGDALSTSRLVRSTMYNAQPETWLSLDKLHRTEIDLTASGLMRRLENRGNLTFVSKTPTIRGYSSLAGRLVRMYSYDDVLAGSVTGTNRLWFSRSVGIVDRSEDCFDVFLRRAAKLGAPPMVIHPQTAGSGVGSGVASADTCEAVINSLPPAERVNSFKVLTYRPSHLSLQVDVPAAGWLLVTDTWSRSWDVTVNGRESRLFRGNFVFRAVQIQPGTSTIDFRYHAIGFPWLLTVSWGLLLSVGAWGFRAAARNLDVRDSSTSRDDRNIRLQSVL